MFSLALLNRVRIGVVFGLIAASLPAQARASQLDVVSITPTAADRSIQHDIGGVTMQFEERSIDLALLAELSDADQVRRSPHGTLAPAGSEPAMLFSPVYQVPIEKPEPWLDVVVLWKISSGDAHSIAIELQGSVDGVDWAEWQSIRCMCCGVREVEENLIVSQLNTMDAATRYVRFRVLWPKDGQAVELEWVKLHFISPGASPPELLEPQRAPLADIGTMAIARPPVITRAEWACPDGNGSRWAPSYANFTHLTVHHTVTPNSESDWAARVRSIWNQHAISQGWGDIGYHFLIAGNGTIYQGRAGALDGDPVAAHVGGHNTRNMGVSLMGTFTSVMPAAAALNSLDQILAWKADQRGINPLGSSTHASSGRFMPNITGHRDWAATACPGDTFYPTLPTVRNNVNALINAGSVPTPVAPVSAAASDITSSSFRANWNSAEHATEYLLDVSLTNTFSSFVSGYNARNVGNVTSFNVTGLSASTRYYYRVRARNASGTSGNSSTRQLTTTASLSTPTVIPLAATNITTTSARMRARITQNGGAAITERRFEWGTAGNWTDFTAAVVVTDDTHFHLDLTGLEPGVTYNFRAWARNNVGWSMSATEFFTTTAPVSAPTAPGVLSAINVDQNSFTARWNPSAGATQYYIDVGTGTGYVPGTVLASDDFEGTFPAAGWLGEGGVAKSDLFARSGSYSAAFTANAHALISPVVADPTGLAFWTRWTSPGRTTVVEWVQGNTTSVVAEVVSTMADEFEAVGLTFTDLGEGRFRFRRGNVAHLYIDDLEILQGGTAVPGYRNRSVGNVTSFHISGLQPGTVYYYRVRAAGEGGTSPNSANQSVTTLLPPLPVAPEIAAATDITNTSFRANWSSSANAAEYLLDVSLTETFSDFVGGYNGLSVGNVTSFAVTDLTPGTRYYYRVRARNLAGTSANSATHEVNTPAMLSLPSVITLDASQITPTSARLRGRITADGGATITERRFDWGTGGQWDDWTAGVTVDGDDFYYDLTGLEPGVTYTFRAWAQNSEGWTFSDPASFSTPLPSAPPAPSVLPATGIGETGFTAQWTAADGASNYYIDIGTGTDYTLGSVLVAEYFAGAFPATGWLGEGGIAKSDSFSHSGTYSAAFTLNAHALESPLVTDPAGLTFWTRWAATNRTTIIEWVQGNTTSVVAEVVSTVANAFEEVALPFSGLGEGRFRFRRGSAAHLYIDDISILEAGSAIVGYQNRSVGNVTSLPVAGLQPDTLYYYRVRAAGEGGTSPNSANQSVTTLPPHAPPAPPVISVAGNVTADAFDFSWEPVAGATHYVLDVATSADFSPGVLAFDESFEGAFPPPGWDHVSCTQSSAQQRTGDYSVLINTNADRLITPEISNPSSLTFWTRWTAVGRTTAIEWVQGDLTSRVAEVTSTIGNAFEKNVLHFRNLGTGRFQFLRSGTTANVYIDDVSARVGGSLHAGYAGREITGGSSVTVTNLAGSTTYYYRLRAGNDIGLSDYSIVREVQTPTSPSSVVTLAPVPVPRTWLEEHFGAGHYEDSVVLNRGPNQMLVWQSFVAGLDPNDPTAVLAGEGHIPAQGPRRPVIQWQGTDQSGRTYSIYGSTNLASPFIPIATDLPNQYPAMNVYTDQVFQVESGPVYYRIRVHLDP